MQTNSRFVFVSHGNTTNGAELCLIETVKALKLQGCDDIWVLLKSGGAHMEKLLSENGVSIRHVANNPRWLGNKLGWMQKLRWLKSTISIFVQFVKLFRELKPDFVITNSVVCNPASGLAAKLMRSTHVWYIHELGDKDHGYHYYFGKKLTWNVIKLLSDRIIFNSRFTMEHFHKESKPTPKKIKIIYYAVPIDRFKISDNRFDEIASSKWKGIELWKILVSGRTSAGKGQEDIINAVEMLKSVHGISNFHLTVLGKVDGPYYEKLKSLVNKHSLNGHVTILPFVDDPSKFYSEAHVGVTTSRNEAFGRITVEYMKSNMVVIGANAGATSEIVMDGMNGFLYELGDIAHFAKIIAKIMHDVVRSTEFASMTMHTVEQRFNLAIHGAEVKSFLFND